MLGEYAGLIMLDTCLFHLIVAHLLTPFIRVWYFGLFASQDRWFISGNTFLVRICFSINGTKDKLAPPSSMHRYPPGILPACLSLSRSRSPPRTKDVDNFLPSSTFLLTFWRNVPKRRGPLKKDQTTISPRCVPAIPDYLWLRLFTKVTAAFGGFRVSSYQKVYRLQHMAHLWA